MIFYTNGLLSKWGFQDGDILIDLVFDHNIEMPNFVEESHCREHQALICLVKTHIVPKINQKIVVVEISCYHNPIRAKFVNGEDVTAGWYDASVRTKLTPETVEIPNEIIVQTLRDFAAKPPPAGTPPA